MRPIVSRLLIALGALLILAVLNTAIADKERIKRSGDVVYLALAPVDPRSLIQGDYMALRFAIVQELEARAGTITTDGAVTRVPVALDARGIAHLADAASAASLTLRYRIRDGHVWLGTNAFFFEEGSAQRFSAARYGEFRVDRESGEAVLVGLRNASLERL